jgi:hypothetical protein
LGVSECTKYATKPGSTTINGGASPFMLLAGPL